MTATASPTTATSAPTTSPTVQEATPRQVQQWLQKGEAVLIDVREPDEHARERIAGSRLVPLSNFDLTRVAAGLVPAQRIVLHCRGGKRSLDAANRAAVLAVPGRPVYSMAGGIEAWKQDNLPVQTNAQVARMSIMRQVQLVVGLATLAGSVLAYLVDPLFIGIPAFFGAGLTFAGATGTCALASILSKMPWNKAAAGQGSCSSGRCGA